MLRQYRCGLFAAVALLGASALALNAQATTLAAPTPPMDSAEAPTFGWTGFHIGLGGGYGVATNNAGFQIYEYMDLPYEHLTPGRDVYSLGASVDFGGRGAIGAVDGGFDLQLGKHFVIGVLGDYTFRNIDTVGRVFGAVCYEMAGPDDCDTATVSDNPEARLVLTIGNSRTVGGRAGFLANPRTLIYGLLGYTRTTLSLTGSFTSDPTGTSSTAFDPITVNSITYGVGVETLLTPNVSAKLEYRFTPVIVEESNGDASFGFRLWDHAYVQTIRGTVSFRFPSGLGTQVAETPMDGEPVSWTAFHLGAEGGYGGVSHNFGVEVYDHTPGGLLQIGGLGGTIEGFDLFSVGASIDVGGRGPIESISAGYDWQIGNHFVFGLLGDYTFANITSTASAFAAVCFDTAVVCNTPQDPLMPTPDYRVDANLTVGNTWTVGARAGFLAGERTLLYVLGAYSDTSLDLNATLTTAGGTTELFDYPFSRNAVTFGAGIEAMLVPHVTAKLEYRGTIWTHDEILFGDAMTGAHVVSNGYEQTIRGGLTWRFGNGA
jgi:opacity protein-like surface antigen